jgi:pilus assembly protein CpaE
MGDLGKTISPGKHSDVNLPHDICIVAGTGEIDRLRTSARLGSDVHYLAIEPSCAVPDDLIARAAVMVMEIDPQDHVSMRRIAQVRSARPTLPIIVALRDANVQAVRTLVRQGVNDVCSLPFDADELIGQLIDLAAQLRDDAAAQAPLSPLVSVVRSTGGSGATTVVTHLAAALAERSNRPKRACLIDLDIQFGNVGTTLGRTAKMTVLDLLAATDRLDAHLLASAVVDTGRGFDVLLAPEQISPLDGIDADQLFPLLSAVRRQYGAVLVDLPANWTNWTLSTVLASTEIVLVTDLSIQGLRQAKRRIELFDSVGVRPDAIRVVVNRFEKRLFRTIGVDEVRNALGRPVVATLSAEPMLNAAQDQGLLVGEAQRKSKFAADIASLADSLAQGWRA